MDYESTKQIRKQVFYIIEKYLFLRKLRQFEISLFDNFTRKYRWLGSYSEGGTPVKYVINHPKITIFL